MKISIVDVFAETKYAGNQLAVVEDAASLDTEAMQSIARETNFSETTFVVSQDEHSARVRIFTPDYELPFAGHPTLGTAWVLTGGARPITLELDAGPVPVTFDADGMAWMQPPEVEFGETADPAAIAPMVGLAASDLLADWPLQWAFIGPDFLLVPVEHLERLQAARVDVERYAAFRAAVPGNGSLFLFSPEAYGADADYAARMFFESAGTREDAATGSANSAFAAYLKAQRGVSGRVVVDQGVEIDRPSRLYLDLGERLAVGGRVIPTVSGTLL
ncbi:MAG: PhzF family phenazine biosynthesis protein [Pseudomonadota bacterium]